MERQAERLLAEADGLVDAGLPQSAPSLLSAADECYKAAGPLQAPPPQLALVRPAVSLSRCLRARGLIGRGGRTLRGSWTGASRGRCRCWSVRRRGRRSSLSSTLSARSAPDTHTHAPLRHRRDGRDPAGMRLWAVTGSGRAGGGGGDLGDPGGRGHGPGAEAAARGEGGARGRGASRARGGGGRGGAPLGAQHPHQGPALLCSSPLLPFPAFSPFPSLHLSIRPFYRPSRALSVSGVGGG